MDELLAAIHPLAWSGPAPLRCSEPGHPAGHACLPLPDGTDPAALTELLSRSFGQHRTLAASGWPFPDPFDGRARELRLWTCHARWIGCGLVVEAGGARPVLLVAERTAPTEDGLPEDSSWVDRIVAVTGWEPQAPPPVDWAAAETRLGTALPGDYKLLADTFGQGAFDAFLDLAVPDSGLDLVTGAEWTANHAPDRWHPHQPFPAPGGLLEWASTEHSDHFFWLTEGTDPDRWPILATGEDRSTWHRFDGSTAEFVHHLLTDPEHPFSTARYFALHWFLRPRRMSRVGGLRRPRRCTAPSSGRPR